MITGDEKEAEHLDDKFLEDYDDLENSDNLVASGSEEHNYKENDHLDYDEDVDDDLSLSNDFEEGDMLLVEEEVLINEEEYYHIDDEDDYLDDSQEHEEDEYLGEPGEGLHDYSQLDREALETLNTEHSRRITHMRGVILELNQKLQIKDRAYEHLQWKFQDGTLDSDPSAALQDDSIQNVRLLAQKSHNTAQKFLLINLDLETRNKELKKENKDLKQKLNDQLNSLNNSNVIQPLVLEENKNSHKKEVQKPVPHRRKRSMSVGAIAWLNDEDDSDEDENNGNNPPRRRQQRDPSLGQVADLFDEEERVLMGFDKDGHAIPENYSTAEESHGLQFADNDVVVAKPSHQNKRIDPSFGGVADLFGGAEPVNKFNHKAAVPSFGGVMDMFGQADQEEDEEEEEELVKPKKTKKSKSRANRSQKRDPSFGQIADMFADDEMESDDEDELPDSLDGGGDDNNQSLPQKTSTSSQKVNILPSGSSGERKRDPSFGGIADMFADNEDDHEEAEMTYSDQSTSQTKNGSHGPQESLGFGISGMSFSDKFGGDSSTVPPPPFNTNKLEEELKSKHTKELNEIKNSHNEEIKGLNETLKEYQDSKLRLAKNSCSEIDRLRQIITELAKAQQMYEQKITRFASNADSGLLSSFFNSFSNTIS